MFYSRKLIDVSVENHQMWLRNKWNGNNGSEKLLRYAHAIVFIMIIYNYYYKSVKKEC